MILKIDGITGPDFANLVAYIHSDENYLVVTDHMSPRAVKLKSASTNADGMYAVDLDILDRYDSTRWDLGEGNRVASTFVTRVYKLLVGH